LLFPSRMKIDLIKYLNKKGVITALVVCIGIAAAVLIVWTFDLYPIAIVNYHPIMAYKFNHSLDITLKYFNVTDSKSVIIFKKAVFDGLIDEVAMDTELRKSMTQSEINQKIESQVDSILNDSKTQKSLEARSISLDDAKKYFLGVDVKNQLLNSQLSLEGTNLSTWLLEQRKNLKVIILMPHAHWNGNGVEFD